MKYQIQNITIPQEKRADINQKILYVIDNNTNQLTAQDVFNCYTGEGGLHGLQYNDYNNYHEYSEAKKDIEQGQFFTPSKIAEYLINCIKPEQHDTISDLCCGSGAFFNYCPNEYNIYGCELDIKAYKVCKYLYSNANISNDDIRSYNPNIKMDIIIGNPPFNLKWQVGKDEYISQLYYCIKAAELLKPMGIMALIVPSSFMADDFIDKGIIKEIDNRFNFICQFDLLADSFRYVGVTNYNTKIMIFQKQSEYSENKSYSNIKIDLIDPDNIYNTYIKPLQEEKAKFKSKLYFENRSADSSFVYKVNKYLYSIKVNPKINNKYGKAYSYYEQFLTQKQPEDMKYEEWEKVKITENKVLSYLKRIVKSQNNVEVDKIQLVKTDYTLKLKAYSNKTKIQLSKLDQIKSCSINDAICYNRYSFEDKTYKKLIEHKRKQFEKQTIDFNDVEIDTQIAEFINKLSFYDSVKNETIKLNTIQAADINKLLQKDYGFIQYSMGGGKTLQGITYGLYHMQYNNINNPIVIGESIAIKGTWMEVLENYNIPYIQIEKLSDFKNIEQRQFILISLYAVNKFKKQIKKFLKINNKKYALIFDESDSITSLDTQAYKAVLACFRRLVRYKLLMTGTSTRNNANEVFGQLELLYNNSINMLCTAHTVYETNKKDNDINSERNIYYMKPFPAYKEGFNLFRKTFSPAKVTVFGLDKYNQDIYNSDELTELLNYTVITKTFEEITGRKAFDGKIIPCYMTEAETVIYNKIIKEFYDLERLYYSSTGNARKDCMLRALHQLNLLLRACSRFHMITGYIGHEISSKHKEIINYINNLPKQRIAIGCIEKESCNEYENILKNAFPDRKIFVVNGEKYNINQRKKLIKDFKMYDDCIIIATQSSLSCSLNINFVDEIIIPELQWNNSRIEQFAFRFIRYDSKNQKNVRFFLYANSIEINILKLIMVKEKINMFMKGEDWTEDMLKEKYGLDFEIENMLLYKEKDEDGNLKIVWNQWGKQKIS